MDREEHKQPGLLTAMAIAIWMAAVALVQLGLYGPYIDLVRLTKLPLGFFAQTWLPLLRDLLTAPLGK